MGILKIAIALLPQIFSCDDALDTYSAEHLPELSESLGDIVREPPTTRILLSEGPHVIEDNQVYFTDTVVVPINTNVKDLQNCPEIRLDRDSEPGGMGNDLRTDIVRVILGKISDK